MADGFFKDLFDVVDTGAISSASVPTGVYDVTVKDARTNVASNQIWLTLEVLNGPAAGKETEVSLYFPGEGSKRGAIHFFQKKIGGFAGDTGVKEALRAAVGAASNDDAFQGIADALSGVSVTAELKYIEEGTYKGTNELVETKAYSGSAPAAQPQAVAQPQVEQPVKADAGVPF